MLMQESFADFAMDDPDHIDNHQNNNEINENITNLAAEVDGGGKTLQKGLETVDHVYVNLRDRIISGFMSGTRILLSSIPCTSEQFPPCRHNNDDEPPDQPDSQSPFMTSIPSETQAHVIDRPILSSAGPPLSPPHVKKSVKLKPYDVPTEFTIEPMPKIKKASVIGSHSKLGTYNMKSRVRGVLFFVNIINFANNFKKRRNGAENDHANLVTLFRELGYIIFYYEDLTKLQFECLLKDLIESKYLKGVDSFVMCLQSHGDMKDVFGNSSTSESGHTLVEFTDGETLGIEAIIKSFSNHACESLANKPKVFFFPFCRGETSDTAKPLKMNGERRRIETDGWLKAEVPTFSDILICYATLPGFAAHRDTFTGSWYITELCKVIADHAHDTHLEDMLKILATKVLEIRDGQKIQVSSAENRGFTKVFFFNPKI